MLKYEDVISQITGKVFNNNTLPKSLLNNNDIDKPVTKKLFKKNNKEINI